MNNPAIFARSGALLAACLISVSPLAMAQHVTGAPSAADAPKLPIEEQMGEPLDKALAAAIESAVIDGVLDEELEGEFGSGVIVATRAAYAQRLFRPIWSMEGADSLIDARGDLFAYGIASEDVLPRDVTEIAYARFGTGTAEERARADIRMTASWLRMAKAVSGGLDDEGRAMTATVKRPTPIFLTKQLQNAGAGDADTALADFEPTHPQYLGLKTALKHYRDLHARGGWLAIPDGEAVELGDVDERVPALRARLEAEGYDAATPLEDVVEAIETVIEADADMAPADIEEELVDNITTFDESLDQALRAFQRRHGLEDDGVLGGKTLEALNESPESKIDRIADTMNRWRQHGDLGERYIWANTPSYLAEGWNNGEREIRMRTIVGKKVHATPVFSDNIEYVVANPKWYTPVSIARRDKVPKLANDPSYANRKNFSIFDRETGEQVSAYAVDWTDPAAAQKYRLVQGSGASNALGEMKIIFPNQYSVYLHGTPGKNLFERSQRAFSSGCVRLEDPSKMAKWLARHDEEVTPTEIEEALAEGDREKLVLEEQTPVHITYMTVTISDNGQPMFWRDVYDKDDGIEFVKKYAAPYEPGPRLAEAISLLTTSEN